MTAEEFSNQFDVQFSNIASNQAPGLNEYEKSVFLTKAQNEIVKNYFLPQSNPKQAGYDDNQKRQIDFSMLTKVGVYKKPGEGDSGSDPFDFGQFDKRENTKNVDMWGDVMMFINETVKVNRNGNPIDLVVQPLKFDEYSRLMSKPYKRPLKYQAWRLINVAGGTNTCDLIVGPGDEIVEYTARYVSTPLPIIVGDLDGLTIDGYVFGEDTNAAPPQTAGCKLDPILHEEILQRAVELAKIAWTSTGQDNLQAVLQAGQRSE